MKKTLLVFILIFLAIYCVYDNFYAKKTTAPYQAAQIFFVKGNAGLKDVFQQQWQKIFRDMSVQNNDVITTRDDSNVEIKFGKDKNNYLLIKDNASVNIEKITCQGDKKVELSKGEITAFLNKLDADSKFEISTSQAVCGVLGTSFNITANSEFTVVEVYEGTVYIRFRGLLKTLSNKKLVLPAGKKIIINKNNNIEASDLTLEQIKHWNMVKNEIPIHLFRVFYVYNDEGSIKNHYTPSGWVGDYDAIRRESSTNNPHSGATCLKFIYTAIPTQGAGWAGVYWQNPANNWGDAKGGYNLTGAQKFTFFARGEKGGETINRFGIGGIGGNFPGTATREIGPIILTKEWKQYTIELTDLDLSYISGGFYWMADTSTAFEKTVFYLDDIRYE